MFPCFSFFPFSLPLPLFFLLTIRRHNHCPYHTAASTQKKGGFAKRMFTVSRKLRRTPFNLHNSLLPALRLSPFLSQRGATPNHTLVTSIPRRSSSSAALSCPSRYLFVSSIRWQQQQQQGQRPPSPSSSSSELPSIEPVLVELRSIVTSRYPLGELYRALSPESRKILVTHKLPLEELLLHLPNNFVLFRSRLTVGRAGRNASNSGGRSSVLLVSPPYLLPPGVQPLRLPPDAKPLPALAQIFKTPDASTTGSTATSNADVAVTDTTATTDTVTNSRGTHPSNVGTGFVDSYCTTLDRIQEVLTYIPNEWTDFSKLPISKEVKMRCMEYPSVRPSVFFLKHPKYFDIRTQSSKRHCFEVRRSLALQKQLQGVVPPPK